MTFQQFKKSWWSWLFFATIIIVVEYSRGWDRFALVCIAVLAFTGVLRLFLSPLHRFSTEQLANHLAKLSLEQRAQELQRLTREQRTEIEKELESRTTQ